MKRILKTRFGIPVVIVCLILLLAWVAGRRRPTAKQAVSTDGGGLNTQLPSPRLSKDGWWGKMDFYKRAEQDSAQAGDSAHKTDPAQRADSSAARVYRSLAKLRETMQRPVVFPRPDSFPPVTQSQSPASASPPSPSSWYPASPLPPDPELQQLSAMLDKVMAIQHPASLVPPSPAAIATLDTITAIDAVTETEGTLTSGAVIALRVTTDAHLHGLFIPANTLVYGTGTLEEERLHIRVRSIRMGDVLCSVSLEAYDLDGIAGIYVPGSLGRDASKASADEAIAGMNVGTYDPTLGGQAANAGVQTLKSLFSKKVREVRVTIRSGYQVLLK